MKLSSVLEEMKNWIEGRESYHAFILKDIEILEKEPEKVCLYAIVEIDIEADDQEITLLWEEPTSKKSTKSFTMEKLYSAVLELTSDYSDFSVFSGSPVESIDDEYRIRLDVPIVSCGINDEDKTFVLIQEQSGSKRNA